MLFQFKSCCSQGSIEREFGVIVFCTVKWGFGGDRCRGGRCILALRAVAVLRELFFEGLDSSLGLSKRGIIAGGCGVLFSAAASCGDKRERGE